jgi:hypothetical protein
MTLEFVKQRVVHALAPHVIHFHHDQGEYAKVHGA